MYYKKNLQHNSLLIQNSIKFGTDFTQLRKKFTQARLVCFSISGLDSLAGLVTKQVEQDAAADLGLNPSTMSCKDPPPPYKKIAQQFSTIYASKL